MKKNKRTQNIESFSVVIAWKIVNWLEANGVKYKNEYEAFLTRALICMYIAYIINETANKKEFKHLFY